MATIKQKIVPHLWYDKEAREAAEFYVSVFPDSRITSVTAIHDTPSGDTDVVSFELFGQLLDVVKMEVTRILMTVRIQTQEEVAQAAEAIEDKAEHISNVTYTHPNEDGSVATETDEATRVAAVPRVGRNEPCPCGSGKKYKHCHGQLA